MQALPPDPPAPVVPAPPVTPAEPPRPPALVPPVALPPTPAVPPLPAPADWCAGGARAPRAPRHDHPRPRATLRQRRRLRSRQSQPRPPATRFPLLRPSRWRPFRQCRPLGPSRLRRHHRPGKESLGSPCRTARPPRRTPAPRRPPPMRRRLFARRREAPPHLLPSNIRGSLAYSRIQIIRNKIIGVLATPGSEGQDARSARRSPQTYLRDQSTCWTPTRTGFHAAITGPLQATCNNGELARHCRCYACGLGRRQSWGSIGSKGSR